MKADSCSSGHDETGRTSVEAAPTAPSADTPGPIRIGDTVRVKEPQRYLVAFASRIKDRDALVLWVGPDAHGQFKGQARVRFLRRRGRGKEFVEVMYVRDLRHVEPPSNEQSASGSPSRTDDGQMNHKGTGPSHD